MTRTTATLFALAVLAAGTSAAQTTRTMTPLDLVSMDRVSDPQPAPDGRQVAFVVSALDLEEDRRRTDIWLVGVEGGEPRRLTTHPASDFSPRWSPDGAHLYFLSTRSGSPQVWRLAMARGEAEPVTELPLDVATLTVSPDGTQLAVSMEVFIECDTLRCTAQRLEARANDAATGRLYDSVFVRHWDTWEDGRRSHIFVVPTKGGTPVDVMAGVDGDSPSVPFGGAEEFAFTPDGRGIVFTARVAGREEPWSTNFDLWLAPVNGTSPPRNLTDNNDAWDTGPVFSPDGQTLAYLAMERPGFEADRLRVMLQRWPDGPVRALATDWDRSPGGLLWSPDGGTLYATAQNVGHVSLFAIDTGSDQVTTVLDDLGYVGTPSFAGDRLVFGLDHLSLPVELFTARPDGSDLRQVTHVNADRLAELALGDHEQFSFSGAGGDTIYAQVVKPASFDPGRLIRWRF